VFPVRSIMAQDTMLQDITGDLTDTGTTGVPIGTAGAGIKFSSSVNKVACRVLDSLLPALTQFLVVLRGSRLYPCLWIAGFPIRQTQ
jgi:hypothetical protein